MIVMVLIIFLLLINFFNLVFSFSSDLIFILVLNLLIFLTISFYFYVGVVSLSFFICYLLFFNSIFLIILVILMG